MNTDVSSDFLPRKVAIPQCPLCRTNNNAALVYQVQDYAYKVPGKYAYQRCNKCRTIFQSPMVIKEDLPYCYPNAYLTHTATITQETNNVLDLNQICHTAPKNTLGFREKLRCSIIKAIMGNYESGMVGKFGRALSLSRKMREKAFFNLTIDELLPRQLNPGNALDIGCGSGRMLSTLVRLGWNVTGVEWDEKAVEIARQIGPNCIYAGDFREVDLPQAKYQLILLNHVFEHIDDPVKALKRIRELLAPNGRVVLVSPNPNAFGLKVHKEYWNSWEAPRHLVFLPPSAYEQAANQVGLKVSVIRTLCRHKGWDFAQARAYREGIPFDIDKPNVKIVDKLLFILECSAIAFGLDVGEEVIIVLEKVTK